MTTLKITHYLNKKLKPLDNGLNEFLLYPVYVRILYGSEVFRIKSPIFDTGNKWEDYKDDEIFKGNETQNKIKYESDLLKYIYSNNFDFRLKSLNELVKALTGNFIDEVLKNELYISTFLDEFVNEFSIFLQEKTGINKNYFLKNLTANNIRSYEYLVNKFPTENKVLNFHFKLIVSFIEFEKEHFNETKPLNIFEWQLNNGREKYLNFIGDDLKETNIFPSVIATIDYFSKGKIYGFELDQK